MTRVPAVFSQTILSSQRALTFGIRVNRASRCNSKSCTADKAARKGVHLAFHSLRCTSTDSYYRPRHLQKDAFHACLQ